jgi:hypothetical protein
MTLAAVIVVVGACHAAYNWNITAISEKMYWVGEPSLHDGMIAWSAKESLINDWQDVYYWRNGAIVQLTDNPWYDVMCSAYNGQILYRSGWPGEVYDLSLWNGSDTVLVDGEAKNKGSSSLYEGSVAYSKELGDTNWEIFRWDGEKTEQISNNGIYNFYPVQYEDTVMWLGGDESRYHYDIYYYDGKETTVIPAHATMWRQSLYDGMIAWAEVDEDWQEGDIWMWEDGVKRQVTSSPYRDLEPSLFDGMMAYVAVDGPAYTALGHINLWDGENFHQVSELGYYDRYPSLCISGNQIQIAWVRYYPDEEWEQQVGQIFYATCTIPEPSTVAVVFSGTALFLWRFRRRSRY